MNKLILLLTVMILAGCSASIGTTPATTTTYTTPTVSSTTYSTPVAETTTVTHY